MIILIEGPDGAGKTNLAYVLCEFYRFTGKEVKYIHQSKPVDNKQETINNYYLDLINKIESCAGINNDKIIILDRSFISNEIYQTYFDNGQGIVSENIKNKLIQLIDRTYIILPEDKQQYLKDYEQLCKVRKELYTNINDMSNIYDAYSESIIQYKSILLSMTVIRNSISTFNKKNIYKNAIYILFNEHNIFSNIQKQAYKIHKQFARKTKIFYLFIKTKLIFMKIKSIFNHSTKI